ncbi:MAG TPA: hypothetical protein VFA47_04265 [Candidatus Manganitrophaceae bacterium]|nr:hypothetical protein [Candidatus Manganitrophaceae bacterium]
MNRSAAQQRRDRAAGPDREVSEANWEWIRSVKNRPAMPRRFGKNDPLSFEEVMERMTKGLAKFNPEKIKMEDLAKSGGSEEEGE